MNNHPFLKMLAQQAEPKGNYRYVWVSKRILEVPVIAADGSLTNIKQRVAETRGRTYRREQPKKMSKKAYTRMYDLLTKKQAAEARRTGLANELE